MKVPEESSTGLDSSTDMSLFGGNATVGYIDSADCRRQLASPEAALFPRTPPEEDSDHAVDQPWYVVHTKVKQEEVASDNLVRQGYTVYLPRIKVLKRNRAQRCQELQFEPLFPRYLFLQPGTRAMSVSPVRSSLGVTAMVRFGQTLAVLRNGVLKSIRDFETRQNEAGLEDISPFRKGESVLVVDGPLAGMEGLVSIISHERIVVLMHLLGHDTRVTLSHDQLQVVN